MRINELHWNDWNEDHIARHGVAPDEVEEVVFHRSYYLARIGGDRYLVIGRTDGGRLLSIIVDRDDGSNFFVVTARDAAPKERRLYQRHGPR